MRKMMTFVAAMLLAVTANAKVLWSEDFGALAEKNEQGYWPYAGGDASIGHVYTDYSNDYEAVNSYGVSVRTKFINGDKETKYNGFYFGVYKEEAKNYVELVKTGLVSGEGMFLNFDFMSDQVDVVDLSKFIVKINGEAVAVPIVATSAKYFTASVSIAIPEGDVNSIYFALDNYSTQIFITNIRIIDTEWNIDLHSMPLNGGTVQYSAEKDLIQAIPNDGYIFLKWSDGNTSNPRAIEVVSDTSFTAEFVGGEGKCGETLVWAYNSTEHQISIVGAGEMDLNYEEFTWFDFNLSRSVQQLSLDEGMTNIDTEAFKGFHYLNTVTIPASVECIEESAFEDCRLLNSVVFAGKNLQSIGNWAFYNCHELQSIIIPEGVQEIGHAAFFNCVYLQELTLPATMRRVEDNSFAQCTKLKKMIVKATTPPVIDAKTFEGVDRNIPLIVPKGSELLYSEADYWREFININPVSAAIDQTVSSSSDGSLETTKFLHNGQVLIQKNDRTFTILGQEVR